MKAVGEWALRAFGVLLLLGAFGFAATKAPDRSLESLVARWAPPPSDFIELDGQLVHLRDVGPRDDPLPLVLIHGTSASLHTWQGWAAELQKTRRVITFDLPGSGLTGPAVDKDYSDEAYLRFMKTLFDRLGLERVILGGNSLGGQLAWEFAAAAPERVAALVLVDADGYAPAGPAVPLLFKLARLPVLEDISRQLLPHALVTRTVRETYGDPTKVDDALVDRYFELMLRQGNREALLQRLSQLEPGRYADRIGALRQPTLILWGGRDRLIPLANGQRFSQDIQGSRLVVFDALGHVPQEEDPLATLAPVQQFLRSLGPDRR